jgi:hypothetical protein
LILTRDLPCVNVSNVLSDDKKQQVIALGRLGWSLRRIEAAVHIRRETVAGYLRAMGIPVRPPGGWGKLDPAKAANEVITDFGAGLPPVTVLERKPITFFCQYFRCLPGSNRVGTLAGSQRHGDLAGPGR